MTVLSDERGTVAVWQSAPASPKVNLLPPELRQRRRLRRVQLGVGGGLVTVVGVVASLAMAASATLQEAHDELAASSTRGAALQAQTAEYVDVLAVHRSAAAAQDMLALAMADEVRFSGLLDDLSRTVPDSVWLEDVAFSQPVVGPQAGAAGTAGIGTVTFTGVAFSHDDVAAWLDALATQTGYADPSLTSSTATAQRGRRTVDFTSTVTLTSAALSGRHTSTTAED
jgi:type IV pilus assembly protein PilN